MPKRKPKLSEFVFVSNNGARRKVKARAVESKEGEYVVLKGTGFGISSAVVFAKATWRLEGEPPLPTPESEPEPVPEPSPLPTPKEDFTDEDMDLINKMGNRASGGAVGDLTKELPGEYNVRVKHDIIGANDLIMMKAKVDSEFALQEGKRKAAQARARRQLLQNAENTGVGWIPDQG